MPIWDDDRELDANFTIEPETNGLSLVFDSCGGGYNKDYNAGLELLLVRLGANTATLTRAEIDTKKTEHLSEQARFIPLRRGYPVDLNNIDAKQLRRDLGASMKDVGSERETGDGNRQKRVRLYLEFDGGSWHPAFLETRLRGRVDYGHLARDSSRGSLPAIEDRDAPIQGLKRASAGRSSDAARNAAIENRAMELAASHYSARGWYVRDVSELRVQGKRVGYDLACTTEPQPEDPNNYEDPELAVEVKGTSTAGDAVIVTHNEVDQARRLGDRAELFVVANIQYKDGEASGGEVLLTRKKWVPEDPERLVPTQYTLTLT
ncbi:hypothetical protein PPSIR1_06653 [Plesiocystis pacifica SIR-1]|uniref:Protein NO VEIN C-terminal domain-containing protein n=1 Tax=Plesiocystis pacifica SIR-1 TaxID=391625 RepID=A6GKM6_9BACT|nr:DUF3883 domain-containing protein [Plesiocystis pacifica]EDM73580.1 hypothetical protein PPSIR1_06653 [Plesiocystis pacifica SIR-1]